MRIIEIHKKSLLFVIRNKNTPRLDLLIGFTKLSATDAILICSNLGSVKAV